MSGNQIHDNRLYKGQFKTKGICMTWFDVNPYMCNIIHICIII